MKNLNMGLKLGIGFGLVLLLTCTLGVMAYTNMSATSLDSDRIALEFVPEVEQAVALDRALRQAALQVRTYDLSRDATAYAAAQVFFKEATTLSGQLGALSTKFPHQEALQKFVNEFPTALNNYIEATRRSHEQAEKMAANSVQRTELAEVADDAFARMSAAIVSAMSDPTSEADASISALANDLLITEGLRRNLMDVRRLLALAELHREQSILDAAMKLMQEGMDKSLAELKERATTPDAISAFDRVATSGNNFQRSVLELSSIWQEMAKARTDRVSASEKVFGLTLQINDDGMIATRELSNFTSENTTVEARQMLYLVFGVLLIGAFIAFLLTRAVTGPLMRGMVFAQAVAAGHLDENLDVHSKDELGRLADALRSMVTSLKAKIAEAVEKSEQARVRGEEATAAMETARQAQAAAESAKREGMLAAADQLEDVVAIVSSASTELSAQIEQSERGSAEQAARVAETATAMEEMNSTVMEVAKNAGTASDVSVQTRTMAEDGAKVVLEVVASIQSVQKASLTLKTDMTTLSEQAQAISQIMGVISDIADQTNLLALNAAIEAARAGEAGRGFAVVADEVRKLAEKTMASTTDVGNAIRSIQQSAEKSVQQVDDTVQNIELATTLATRSGEALREIVKMVDNTADQVRAIATASEQQSATSDEINRSIVQVSSIASETARAMQEATQAVSDLANQAQVLTGLIEGMKRG